MRGAKLNFYFLLLCIAASLARGKGDAKVALYLPEKSSVIGPFYTLGEVVLVTGPDRETEDRFRKVQVGKAPPAGDKVEVTRGSLLYAVRKAGFSAENVRFEGAERTEIRTQSQKFRLKELLPEIKTFILGQLDARGDDIDVQWVGAEKELTLPSGEVTIRIKPSLTGKYDGTVFLHGDLQVDGRLVKQTNFRVQVDRFRSWVMTKKAIGKGEKFTEGNLALTRTPLRGNVKGGFSTLKDVLGRTAVMQLAPEKILRASDVLDPPLVHHGDIVQGIVEMGNVQISAQFRAVEDGKTGDVIRVENTSSHKLLNGKVVDERTVVIQK